MFRSAACLALLALCLVPGGGARAWQVEIGPVCRLTHETDEVAVELTYDPARPEYRILLTLTRGTWPAADIFSMRFDGPRPNQIYTHRHVIDEGGRRLHVTDRGFGNVLDGLQFNDVAHALAGTRDIAIPLDGAAPHVAEFRACPRPVS